MITEPTTLSLCFHRGGTHGKKKVMSNIIKALTGGPFSHVELYLPHNNQCFSASGYEDLVRWKRINFTHPERWVFVPIVTNVPYKIMLQRCRLIEGAKYDHIGAFFSRGDKSEINNRQRWFCSEACSYVANLTDPWAVSPNRLYYEVL